MKRKKSGSWSGLRTSGWVVFLASLWHLLMPQNMLFLSDDTNHWAWLFIGVALLVAAWALELDMRAEDEIEEIEEIGEKGDG